MNKEEKIRENTKIAEEILMKIIKKANKEVSTFELNEIARKEFEKYKAKPAAFLFGYPNYISIAKDEQVFFGPIDKKEFLKEGDLVKIALGLYKNDYFTDLGFTFLIGEASEEKKNLVKGTANALSKAIGVIKPDAKIYEISRIIEETLTSYNLSPVYEILGHGVGRNLHEPPYIPNKTRLPLIDYEDKIKEADIICIEPIATAGNGKIKKVGKGRLDYRTKDKKPVAHFELPILVKREGSKILAKTLYELIQELLK